MQFSPPDRTPPPSTGFASPLFQARLNTTPRPIMAISGGCRLIYIPPPGDRHIGSTPGHAHHPSSMNHATTDREASRCHQRKACGRRNGVPPPLAVPHERSSAARAGAARRAFRPSFLFVPSSGSGVHPPSPKIGFRRVVAYYVSAVAASFP